MLPILNPFVHDLLQEPALRGRCVSEGRLNAYGAVVAARNGMTGNFSSLLFPQVPGNRAVAFAEQYKWPLILGASFAGFAVVAVSILCCCCCCRSHSGHLSSKYRV